MENHRSLCAGGTVDADLTGVFARWADTNRSCRIRASSLRRIERSIPDPEPGPARAFRCGYLDRCKCPDLAVPDQCSGARPTTFEMCDVGNDLLDCPDPDIPDRTPVRLSSRRYLYDGAHDTAARAYT